MGSIASGTVVKALMIVATLIFVIFALMLLFGTDISFTAAGKSLSCVIADLFGKPCPLPKP